MGKQSSEFVAYVTEPPVIEINDRVARVKDRSGNVRIERAMSVRTLEKYRDRITIALDRFAAGDTDIIVDG